MKLIDEARSWYKMFSVQALIVIGAVQATAAVLSADTMAGHIPFASGFTWNDLVAAVTVTGVVLGLIGRLVSQDSVAS